MAAEESSDVFDNVLKFFESVKLTIFILSALAATSVIGTLIPQNEDPAESFRRYGEFRYRVFEFLNIFDMYHSGWFRFLILLLGINIIVCSVNRLSATWKIIFVKTPNFNPAQFESKPGKEFFTKLAPDMLKEKFHAIVARHFSYIRVEDGENGFRLFAEKGRKSRLGVYIVHASVLMLLVGSMIGSIFGFEGFVNIAEGDKTNQIRLRKSNQPVTLPFEIRCDKFDVSFYETGAPKEFRSALTLLENDKPVMRRDIIVNDPLRYAGINIFQASYGSVPSENLTLSFTSKASGMLYTKKTSIGQPVEIPEGLGSFVIDHLRKSYQFMNQDMGDTFVGTLTTPDGKKTEEIPLPLRFRGFDKMRRGNVVVDIAGYEPRYFTGLQVTKDPGVWVVYAGFCFMIIGCFVTFFMRHQRLYVNATQTSGKTKVGVFGISDKNMIGMKHLVANIAKNLSESGNGA